MDTRQRDDQLRDLLAGVRTIAVVGMKAAEAEDAFRVPAYMQHHGYQVVPVNPKLTRVLGQPAFHSLADIDVPIDLVNLFRAPDHIPAHVDEILAMSPQPKAVWMQLGIIHDASTARLRNAGIEVVQDLCIMVEHRRLLSSE